MRAVSVRVEPVWSQPAGVYRAPAVAGVDVARLDSRGERSMREAGSGQALRVALYSHDTMGLGHMRRNLMIAKALAASPLRPTVLMIAGAREAGAFAMPRGVDCLTLPAYRKQSCGAYGPRHLDVETGELVALRSASLRAALEGFDPDLVIVDNVPRGAMRELDSALSALRARGRSRVVLGLRDIRDEPAAVQREWARDANESAIRDHYDEVWIYGDPAVYDLIEACGYSPEVAAKARYTGYLDRRERRVSPRPPLLAAGPIALCMVGGGQDGAMLARAFAQCELPSGWHGVLLAGPFMPEDARREMHEHARSRPRLAVLDFVADATGLVEHAERVITMGGYNSVCEALSFEKPVLIVPRVRPRLEQWIRAERLRELGVADALHPDALAPAALSQWLDAPRDRPPVRERVDMNGLKRLPWMAAELIGAQLSATA